MLQTGSLNFRPPVSRSKSAPRLFAIDEEDECPEEQQVFQKFVHICDVVVLWPVTMLRLKFGHGAPESPSPSLFHLLLYFCDNLAVVCMYKWQ